MGMPLQNTADIIVRICITRRGMVCTITIVADYKDTNYNILRLVCFSTLSKDLI